MKTKPIGTINSLTLCVFTYNTTPRPDSHHSN